ncbi:MAG: hypothetical protein SGI84_04145 [Gemmatimonadota bacterium]|nr:hypothetical protein [Gemmatimonadota bacterium]
MLRRSAIALTLFCLRATALSALPTYPDPVASANLFVSPVSWLTLGAGLYHGTLGDATIPGYSRQADRFVILQADVRWGSVFGRPDGRAAVGRWSHSGLAPAFAGGAVDGPSGWYGLAEQRLSGAGATDSTVAGPPSSSTTGVMMR